MDNLRSQPPQALLGPWYRRAVLALAALLACLLWFHGTGASRASPAEKPEYRFLLSEDEYAECVAFSPDGKKVFAGTNAGQLWTWELKKEAQPQRIQLTSGELLTGPVLSLAISPDGGRALAGCADYRVRLVDLATGQVIHVLEGHKCPVFSVAFCRDGRRALSGSSGSAGTASIFLWDLKTGKPLRRYETDQIVHSLALSPDEQRFLTPEFTSVQEWDLPSGQRLRALKGHKGRIYGVFYSPDGKTIISGGFDAVRVWDAQTGQCLRTLGQGKFDAYHVALSPDGRRMLLGSIRKMHLLDLETGQELKRWEDLAAGFVRVAFSPDGRYAVSGERFRPVSVWRLPEVKEAPPGK